MANEFEARALKAERELKAFKAYTSGGKLHDGADLAIKNMRAAGIEIAKEGSNNKTATASQPKAIDAKDGGGRGN